MTPKLIYYGQGVPFTTFNVIRLSIYLQSTLFALGYPIQVDISGTFIIDLFALHSFLLKNKTIFIAEIYCENGLLCVVPFSYGTMVCYQKLVLETLFSMQCAEPTKSFFFIFQSPRVYDVVNV